MGDNLSARAGAPEAQPQGKGKGKARAQPQARATSTSPPTPTSPSQPSHERPAASRPRKRSSKNRSRPVGRRTLSPPPSHLPAPPPSVPPLTQSSAQPNSFPTATNSTPSNVPSAPQAPAQLSDRTASSPASDSSPVFTDATAAPELDPVKAAEPPSAPMNTDGVDVAGRLEAISPPPAERHIPQTRPPFSSHDSPPSDDTEAHGSRRDSFFSTGITSAYNNFTNADEAGANPEGQILSDSATFDSLSPDGAFYQSRMSTSLNGAPSSDDDGTLTAQAKAEHLIHLQRMAASGLDMDKSDDDDALSSMEGVAVQKETSGVQGRNNPVSSSTQDHHAVLSDDAATPKPMQMTFSSHPASENEAIEPVVQPMQKGPEEPYDQLEAEKPTDSTATAQPLLFSPISVSNTPTIHKARPKPPSVGPLSPPSASAASPMIMLPQEGDDTEEIDQGLWQAAMEDYHKVAQAEPERLAQAVQLGIPAHYRGKIWQDMSHSQDSSLEAKFHAYHSQPSEHDKAIERDLARTYPEQLYFRDASQGQQELFNVVKAYALLDPEVGYCQGMQFIVGPLLLNMYDAHAFTTLVALMQTYDLRGHFSPGMPGLELRMYQLTRLIEDQLPRLYAHIARCGIKTSMYASPWFMTAFCYRFPLIVACRVLDTIFYEGMDALFRFALALLRRNEGTLLELDFDNTVLFLKHKMFEVYRLSDARDDPEKENKLSSSPREGDSSPGPERSTWTPQRFAVNRFMRDASQAQRLINAADLERYAKEYEEELKRTTTPLHELEQLRHNTWKLGARVKEMEADAASQQAAHEELARQVVAATLSKDEVAEQLVRYKMLYAEVSLAKARSCLLPRPPPSQTNSAQVACAPASPGSATTEMERTASSVSHASSTSTRAGSPTVLSDASKYVDTATHPDPPAGTGTVARSVTATVASWGRWMSRSKGQSQSQSQSQKLGSLVPGKGPASPSEPKNQRDASLSETETAGTIGSEAEGRNATPLPLPTSNSPSPTAPQKPDASAPPPLPPRKLSAQPSSADTTSPSANTGSPAHGRPLEADAENEPNDVKTTTPTTDRSKRLSHEGPSSEPQPST